MKSYPIVHVFVTDAVYKNHHQLYMNVTYVFKSISPAENVRKL